MWQLFKLVLLLVAFMFLLNLNERLDARGKAALSSPSEARGVSSPQGVLAASAPRLGR